MSTLARKTARKWLWIYQPSCGRTFSETDHSPPEARITSYPERGASLNTWTAASHASILPDSLARSEFAVRDAERRTNKGRPASLRLHGHEP